MLQLKAASSSDRPRGAKSTAAPGENPGPQKTGNGAFKTRRAGPKDATVTLMEANESTPRF